MQTNTNDKAKAEAYEISKEIFYGQATNGKAEANIQAGAEKILSFAASLKEPEEKWIACSERLPEVADEYIVYIPGFIEPVTTREFHPDFGRFLDVRITQLDEET